MCNFIGAYKWSKSVALRTCLSGENTVNNAGQMKVFKKIHAAFEKTMVPDFHACAPKNKK